MKRCILGVVSFSVLTLGQTEQTALWHMVKRLPNGQKVIEMWAVRAVSDGSVMRLQKAEIKTDSLSLLADEIEFNPNTGEANALGSVHITMAK
jgi:hypothetical protein